jgi:hypothetical protein
MATAGPEFTGAADHSSVDRFRPNLNLSRDFG